MVKVPVCNSSGLSWLSWDSSGLSLQYTAEGDLIKLQGDVPGRDERHVHNTE